jgi:tryptophan halogenase
MPIPDSLANKMELFRERGVIVDYRLGLFYEPSWLAVYVGQRVVAARSDPRLDDVPLDDLRKHAQAVRAAVHTAAESLPTHADFLARHV